jgi:hypothetical protein
MSLKATCFPNPAQDELHFELPSNESMEIILTEPMGRVVKSWTNYHSLSTLTISDLPPGCYFYHIKTKTKQYSGKFVKTG